MKGYRLHNHYSSANRYLGRSSGVRRSSVSLVLSVQLASLHDTGAGRKT